MGGDGGPWGAMAGHGERWRAMGTMAGAGTRGALGLRWCERARESWACGALLRLVGVEEAWGRVDHQAAGFEVHLGD
jgi:hypothetical protein